MVIFSTTCTVGRNCLKIQDKLPHVLPLSSFAAVQGKVSWQTLRRRSSAGWSLNIELVAVVCSDIITLQYEDTLPCLPPVSISGKDTGQSRYCWVFLKLIRALCFFRASDVIVSLAAIAAFSIFLQCRLRCLLPQWGYLFHLQNLRKETVMTSSLYDRVMLRTLELCRIKLNQPRCSCWFKDEWQWITTQTGCVMSCSNYNLARSISVPWCEHILGSCWNKIKHLINSCSFTFVYWEFVFTLSHDNEVVQKSANCTFCTRLIGPAVCALIAGSLIHMNTLYWFMV